MGEKSSMRLPRKVDPGKLVGLMEEAGWQPLGGRRGVYKRFSPPLSTEAGRSSSSLVIPLDEDSPEYTDLMHSALQQLSEDSESWVRLIYPRLLIDASDQFKFRRESSAPSGFIDWRSGERLIESARRTLLAGAKFYLNPDRHYVNRNGRFAGRYLDQVLMGQTSPGSYIVTAYAPPEAGVSLSSADAFSLPHVGSAPARDVSLAVVKAVEATAEAIDHYKTSGSLSGFEDGVSRGISYEMAQALLGLTEHSDGADVSVEWDSGVDVFAPPPVRIEFSGADAAPLAKAAVSLAEDKSSRTVTIIGRVHLLAKKQAGSPGVFGVEALAPSPARKVRVRLADEEDYHEAIRAHEEDLAIQVSGNLEKEGNLSWLYNATVIRTMGHVDDYRQDKRRRISDVDSRQLDFFSGE
ncbi:hypothetical protein [Streptomyces sp. NBC_01237]|uniref:hypothetical protein n=1 Tax=Streptomyces sp. NBC_01237 TaxID=2903790 RepID=UPI002DD81AC6|nr:hypothetical protein [Streptomyces sp. NBC_01237]WRZ73495.1 hypothetical protein OG251_18685 [Streptomyces sp. NBC_01237]